MKKRKRSIFENKYNKLLKESEKRRKEQSKKKKNSDALEYV